MSIPDRKHVIRSAQSILMVTALFLLLLPPSSWAVECDRSNGEAAIESCRQALQDSPQDVDTLKTYAEILIDLERPGEAIDLLAVSYTHLTLPTTSP